MPSPMLPTPTRQYLSGKAANIGPVRQFLELHALETSSWYDDFQGDTLHGGYQSTASGANSAAAAISTGVVNGAILLDPGDANSGRSDLSLGLHYQGQLNAVMWAKMSMSALTSAKFEIGFTDTVSGTDAGAVNSKSGNTWTATDAALLVYDTSDDTNLTLMGVATNTAATVIDLNTALSAATYYYFGVYLKLADKTTDTISAKGFLLNLDGKLLEETAWMESAVAPTVLLTPWLFVQNRSGARRSMTVDLVYSYQRRTTAVP